MPLTTHLSAWYAGMSTLGPIVVLAVAGYAFHASAGEQPAFGGSKIEE